MAERSESVADLFTAVDDLPTPGGTADGEHMFEASLLEELSRRLQHTQGGEGDAAGEPRFFSDERHDASEASRDASATGGGVGVASKWRMKARAARSRFLHHPLWAHARPRTG